MLLLTLVGFVLAFLDVSLAKSLPSFIKTCPKTHSDVNACLVNLIESIRPHLVKGIPEMRVPPIDPFHVPSLTLNQGTGSVNFKAQFRDIKATGAKDFILKSIKIDFNKPDLVIDIFFPVLRIDTNYEINGRVLVLPIKGHGKSSGNFTNIAANVILSGKYTTKNNRQFLEIMKNKVGIKMGGLKIHFANLFNGNKQLSDSTNNFINENWKDIVQEITPLIEETVGTIMNDIIKNIFDTYGVDDLFPPK